LSALLAIALILLVIFGRLERSDIHRKKLFASMFAMLSLFTVINIVFAFVLNAFQ